MRPAAPPDDLYRYIHGNVSRVLILVVLVLFLCVIFTIDVDLLSVAAFRLGVDRVGSGLCLFLLNHIDLARLRRRLLSLGDRGADGRLLHRLGGAHLR